MVTRFRPFCSHVSNEKRGALYDRGEVRTDIDVKMVVSLVDWLMDRGQDAIVTEELDPGLFGSAASTPAVRDLRVRQIVELLRGAIGARP